MKFVSLCLESSGEKTEYDISQSNGINLDEDFFSMKGTLFQKTCRYEYDNKELFLYTATNSEEINPHSLPYPVDSDIFYGDMFLILREDDFGGKDFQKFYDQRISRDRSDSQSSYRSSCSFESRYESRYESRCEIIYNEVNNEMDKYKKIEGRSRSTSLSFISS